MSKTDNGKRGNTPPSHCTHESLMPDKTETISKLSTASMTPAQLKEGEQSLSLPLNINDSFDTTIAAIFMLNYGDNHRFIRDEERWIYWNGRHWNADIKAQNLSNTLDKMRQKLMTYSGNHNLEKIIKNLSNQRTLACVKKILETRNELSLLSWDCDSHEHLAAFENAVYNTGTGQFIFDAEQIRPLYLIRRFAVAYDNQAECPLWESFLALIFKGDTELIRFVQKAVGLSLSGKILEERLFFAYGSGANGKTTFFEVLNKLFGSFQQEIDSAVLIKSKMQDQRLALENMANLRGIRFATSNEIPERATYNDMIIKQLCSRDEITSKVVFKSVIAFKPTHKLWIRSNHKPMFNVHDGGMMRRICPIPFDYTIPEAERIERYEDVLLKEKKGILGWIVNGWERYKAEGMKVLPPSMQKAMAEYTQECDSLKQFIEESYVDFRMENRSHLRPSPSIEPAPNYGGAKDSCENHHDRTHESLLPKEIEVELNKSTAAMTPVQTLLKDFTAKYNEWCKENNYRSSNSRTLAGELRSAGYEVTRGTDNALFIREIGLKDA